MSSPIGWRYKLAEPTMRWLISLTELLSWRWLTDKEMPVSFIPFHFVHINFQEEHVKISFLPSTASMVSSAQIPLSIDHTVSPSLKLVVYVNEVKIYYMWKGLKYLQCEWGENIFNMNEVKISSMWMSWWYLLGWIHLLSSRGVVQSYIHISWLQGDTTLTDSHTYKIEACQQHKVSASWNKEKVLSLRFEPISSHSSLLRFIHGLMLLCPLLQR